MCSNFSVAELIRYKFDDMGKEQLRDALEQMQADIERMKSELSYYEKAEERISEQVYFGRELVQSILICVEQAPRAKELKAMIKHQVAESSFEL